MKLANHNLPITTPISVLLGLYSVHDCNPLQFDNMPIPTPILILQKLHCTVYTIVPHFNSATCQSPLQYHNSKDCTVHSRRLLAIRHPLSLGQLTYRLPQRQLDGRFILTTTQTVEGVDPIRPIPSLSLFLSV